MLENIYGHKNVLGRLNSVIHKPGSYMFYGPPSVGKKTIAYELTRDILCINKNSSSCTCKSCLISLSDHPDFMSVGRPGSIKVSDIDEILDFVSRSAFLSDGRVTIVDNAETMTWEASNRLLKTLEEPPAGFYFFLITSRPDSILKTIRYRCVEFEFDHLENEDVINILYKKMGFDLPKARVLGWLGSRSSFDIFSKAGEYLRNRDNAIDFMEAAQDKDLLKLLDFMDRISRDEMSSFVDMLILVMTDVLMVQNGLEDIVNADRRDSILKFSEKFDKVSLLILANTISQVKRHQKLNVNMGLFFKSFIIKNAELLKK